MQSHRGPDYNVSLPVPFFVCVHQKSVDSDSSEMLVVDKFKRAVHLWTTPQSEFRKIGRR